MKFDLDSIIERLESNSKELIASARHAPPEISIMGSVGLGLQLSKAGYYSEATCHLEYGIENWTVLEKEVKEEVAESWALALYATGNIDRLRAFVTETTKDLSAETRAVLQIRLSWAELMAGHKNSSLSALLASRRLCDPMSSQRVLSELTYLEGYRSLSHSGDLGQAEKEIDLACALFRLHGQDSLLAHSLQAHATIHWSLGHPGLAEALALESLNIAASLGNHRTASAALRQFGIFKYSQSEFAVSETALDSAIRVHRTLDDVCTPYYLKTKLALTKLALLTGSTAKASEILEQILAHFRTLDSKSLALYHEYHGIAKAQQLDYLAALASFEEAKRCLAASGTTTYELAEVYWQEAEVHLAMHNPRIALDLANEALEVVRACGNRREYGQILRVKATALAQLARPQEAIPLLEEAAAELRRRNNPLELGRTLIQLAGVLDPPSAVKSANEALAIFTRLQLPALENEARQARDLARLRLQAFQSAEEKNHTVLKEGQLIAVSPRMKELLADCDLIAHSSSPAVIMGATGVGKEVVARYIHEHSSYSEGPFVAVNCAALPESLFERELFGHKKGAFTGADRDTAGVVAAATGGTLFLDEIGELPMAMQAKLLRLLQENTYRRVGDVTEYRADIKVLAATNCDLKKQVEDRSFREDLWYRINAFEVRIPLLRERPEDIAPLTDLFLEEQSREYEIEFWMDQQARRLFERYPWPGNVRELQSAVRAGAARAREDGRIRVRHLPHALRESKTKKPPPILSLQQHLEVEERRIILHALRQCKNSRSEAARYLGIGRNTLYEKMQRLGIALDKEAKG